MAFINSKKLDDIKKGMESLRLDVSLLKTMELGGEEFFCRVELRDTMEIDFDALNKFCEHFGINVQIESTNVQKTMEMAKQMNGDLIRIYVKNTQFKNEYVLDDSSSTASLIRLSEFEEKSEFIEKVLSNSNQYQKNIIHSQYKNGKLININMESRYPETIHIQEIKELTEEELEKFPETSKISLKQENNKSSNIYDKRTFTNIFKELQEVTKGIDENLPDIEKFKIVYSRLARKITYDYEAAYPEGDEQQKYADENKDTCRNLENGLLKGKCVCAGYAEILRTVLNMIDIDCLYISGDIVTTKEEFEEKIKDMPEFLKEVRRKSCEKNEYYSVDRHAWNKVNLDGVWYNTDLTWDRNEIVEYELPEYALLSDKTMEEKGRRREAKNNERTVKCLEDASLDVISQLRMDPPYIQKIKKMVESRKMSVKEMVDSVQTLTAASFKEMTKYASEEEIDDVIKNMSEEKYLQIQILFERKELIEKRLEEIYGKNIIIKYLDVPINPLSDDDVPKFDVKDGHLLTETEKADYLIARISKKNYEFETAESKSDEKLTNKMEELISNFEITPDNFLEAKSMLKTSIKGKDIEAEENKDTISRESENDENYR